MTQAEMETELLALRSELNEQVTRAKSREIEWCRLGLIAKGSSILASLTGLGFMITNLVIPKTPTNSNLHDQLVMMATFQFCRPSL
jgi:hypothetical protein